MFWIQGRMAWPLVVSIAYSTLVFLLTDYTWRMIVAPVAVIAGLCAAFLLIGNLAIFLLGAKAR
ncbi:MAG TPA: hypothetical protein VHV26_12035 [Rhizomicrobium sp.]|nr:hypothetical protein [Rhizomicrobium sp.]